MSSDPGQQIDGVLGGNILINERLRIDFQRHAITFLTAPPGGGKLPPAMLAAAGMSGADVIALADGGNCRYFCTVETDLGPKTATVEMLLSTSRKSILPFAAVQYMGLPLSVPTDVTTGLPVGQTTLTRLILGAQTLRDVPFLYLGADDLSGVSPRVGFDVLSRFRVLLDFADKKLYLAPLVPQQPAAPVPAPTAAGADPAAKP